MKKYCLKLIILVIDDQQSGANKQGLTPSPSNAFPSSNTNADSISGMKLLMVPGQNAQMSSFSSGKKTNKQTNNLRYARLSYGSCLKLQF